AVVAADRQYRGLARHDSEGPRRHGLLPARQDRPVAAPIVAPDDQPARVLAGQGRPETPRLLRVRDETGHDVAGKGRTLPQRRPGRAGVVRAVEVSAGRAAEDRSLLERVGREDPHVRAPDGKPPPGRGRGGAGRQGGGEKERENAEK